MHLPRKEEFLEDVMSYVKFPFDKRDIRMELEGHIEDKIDEYMEQGYNLQDAAARSVSDMGDAKELGKELNRQHNPVLGWICTITSALAGICMVLGILFLIFSLFGTLIRENPINRIPKSNIVYKLDINKTVRLDDTIIKFTNVVYDKDGSMSILYHYYDRRLNPGWSLGTIGDITDDLGNKYFTGSGSSSNGIVSKAMRTVSNFSKKATKLIISYDSFNRKYKVEIPLPGGAINE